MPDFSRIALPALPPFKRPHELLYAADERPPASTLSGLALQHIATALALIAYVLAAAKIGGLDAATTQTMISATVLGMAISTFCQYWGGRLGSGMLLIHMPDPLLVVISGMLAGQYGLGGLVLIGVINGLIALGAGSLVPHLRSLLPSTVAGIVVCVAGLSLIEPALLHVSGLAETGTIDLGDLLTGGATLTCIMALSIWGKQRGKLFALLAGLITGITVSFFLGKLEGLDVPATTPHSPTPNLLDIEDDQFQAALDQALSGISQVMLRRLADRLHAEQRGDTSYLKLHFDH